MWRLVRADLTRIDQPLLVFLSATDHVVDGSSAALLRAWTRSVDAEWVPLPRSYHVATLDHDSPRIHSRTVSFVARVTRLGPRSAGSDAPATGQRFPATRQQYPATGRTP